MNSLLLIWSRRERGSDKSEYMHVRYKQQWKSQKVFLNPNNFLYAGKLIDNAMVNVEDKALAEPCSGKENQTWCDFRA
jgi:hypothetical protein